MACQPDVLKQNLALRNYNRELRSELFNLRLSTNGCGVCDSCETDFTLPGVSIVAGALVFTWDSMEGQTFLIESSPDKVTWTVVEEAYPSQGTITEWGVILVENGEPVYYKIRENPITYNECQPV